LGKTARAVNSDAVGEAVTGAVSTTASAAAVAAVASVKFAKAATEASLTGVVDITKWAGLKTLEVGSAAHQAALVALKQTVVAVYGPEALDALVALSDVIGKVSAELQLLRSSTWKFGLLFALPLVHLAAETLAAPMTASDCELEDWELFREARYWLDYARAAYGCASSEVAKGDDDRAKVAKSQALQDKVGVEVRYADLPARACILGVVELPGHFVAVDTERRAVILAVRGTVSIADAITDAAGNTVDLTPADLGEDTPPEYRPLYPGIGTHEGILSAAGAVVENTWDALSEAVAEHPGFDIIVTGHSLGAGTATIATLLLRGQTFPGERPRLRCFAFAPPPVISPLVLQEVPGVEFYSFVNRFDVVPRASTHNILNLGMVALAVDQLDLTLMDRIGLIRRGRSLPGEDPQKLKVVEAVVEAWSAAGAEKSECFPPHFIPGRVFRTDCPDPEEGEGSGALTLGPAAPPPKVRPANPAEFYLSLEGGRAAFADHRVETYRRALDLVLERLELQAKVERLVGMGFGKAQARATLDACAGDVEAAANRLLSP